MITGTVDVNDVAVVSYKIVNKTPTSPSHTHRYEVVASGRDERGYPFDFVFPVEHTCATGIARLMVVVFEKLDDQLAMWMETIGD